MPSFALTQSAAGARLATQVNTSDLSAAFFPPFFAQEEIFTGHTRPTAVRFAPNGNVFVAEKSGLVYAYADGTYSRWGPGESPSEDDPCPDPPGSLGDGCVVYGILSRIQIDPLTLQAVELPVSGIIGPDEPLLSSDWCLQYPSHSLGDLVFGDDEYLYVSAGEGASFYFYDWGQDGAPQNPCDDPPDGVQTAMVPDPNNDTDAEGGALRSQDILTPSDRTDLSIQGRPDYIDRATFNGALLRVDVSTVPVQAPPDNPLVTLNTVPDDDLIVAVGLRNPFRINHRPGTNEIWITDVGWFSWEEINRVADPVGSVENFGWPCYEGDNAGSSVLSRYEQQDLCQALYAEKIPAGIDTTAPFYAYHHSEQVVPGEICVTGTSSATGPCLPTVTVFPTKPTDSP